MRITVAHPTMLGILHRGLANDKHHTLGRKFELVVDVAWLDGKKNRSYSSFCYIFDSEEFFCGFVAISRVDVMPVDFGAGNT